MSKQWQTRRDNFQTAIQWAIESCTTEVNNTLSHFRGATKMVGLGCDESALP